jgi:RNA polymerase sigma-70 factor (ECF subfamily)
MNALAWNAGLTDLYRLHYAAVLSHAKRWVDSSLAEDVAQDVFFRVMKYKGHELEKVSRAYLLCITRNTALTARVSASRRAKVDRTKGESIAERELSPAARAPEARAVWPAWLEAAIATLPPRQREILALTELRGLSEHQAGRSLDISRSAVSARKLSALSQIRIQALSARRAA